MLRAKKYLAVVTFLCGTYVIVTLLLSSDLFPTIKHPTSYSYINWRHLTNQEVDKMSNLGRRMFLDGLQPHVPVPVIKNRNFTIAVWKHGPRLQRRFQANRDPFLDCSVSNCRVIYRDDDVSDADAVLFHLHRTMGPDTLPKQSIRSPSQRWIFLTDENPYNTFMSTKKHRLRDYDGVFNWSMHYRMDADVPVPYGRTIPLGLPLEVMNQAVLTNNKTKLVAVMGSNCGTGSNERWSYVSQLSQHVPVDVYGRCGRLNCSGHFFSPDCPALDDYKFYLAFENGDCEQYLTEKVWWHALRRGAVPVVMGPPKSDYDKLLPPGSFIHVDDYETPRDLAMLILFLNRSDPDYNRYFRWKTGFKVVNEHGYFGAPVYHYCRICEALNYNSDAPKVYRDLEDYWSPGRDCYPPRWVHHQQHS